MTSLLELQKMDQAASFSADNEVNPFDSCGFVSCFTNGPKPTN